jgi:hypothetical protein
MVEYAGETQDKVKEQVRKLEDLRAAQRIGYAATQAYKPEEVKAIWGVRKAGLGLLLGTKGDKKPIAFVEDTAVAPAKLPQFIKRFKEIISSHDAIAGYYGHCSVGCMHIRPLINLKEPSEVDKMVSIANAISDLVLEFNGAMSGEHGDGLARSHFNKKLFGPGLYEAFRRIKRAFDPDNRLNPGKIVDAPAMTESLRAVSQEPLRCAAVWASAGKNSKAPCALLTWGPWMRSILPGGEPMLCEPCSPAKCLRKISPASGFMKSWIYVWSAKRAKPNARRTSIWQSSSTNFSIITIAPMDCRCATVFSAASRA